MRGTERRRSAARTLVVLLAASLTACASVPELPPDAPPMLSPAESGLVDGRPRSGVLVATGAAAVAEASIADGEPLVRIPYRYRHTAVLTKDVKGFSITVPGVQAPAGSPGYYAGTFVNTGSGGFTSFAASELWCFLPSLAGGEREHICLLRDGTKGTAAIAPTRLNPYLWEQFSPATGSFDYVTTPIFARQEVEIPGDLTLEYRFDGWTDERLMVDELAAGRSVRSFAVQRDADGSAKLPTLAGDVLVRPDPADPSRAIASGPGAE